MSRKAATCPHEARSGWQRLYHRGHRDCHARPERVVERDVEVLGLAGERGEAHRQRVGVKLGTTYRVDEGAGVMLTQVNLPVFGAI